MGRMLTRAIEAAGLTRLAERALEAAGLDNAALAHLREADRLVGAGLADAVRARQRGDEVQLHTRETAARAPGLRVLDLDVGRPDGPTGQEALIEVAFARLSAPGAHGIAVDFEQVGLELAQTALAFGADALCGDLTTKRTLPLLEGASARRAELEGLVERGGRRVQWCVEPEVARPRSRS